MQDKNFPFFFSENCATKLPYTVGAETDGAIEQNFQNVIYISLLVLGKYVRIEVHSAQGRADCIIEWIVE